MRLADLISRRNLELAWRRISTARNLQHKRFFRHLYGGYELGLPRNLDLLHARLQGNWRATPPTRIYIPKASGLLRPITLLAVEDQIVLQAIANKIALQVHARRRKVELKQVFSNCLARKDNSIFFLQDWRRTYQTFQNRLRSYLNSGNNWIAHFDLAAFYETISHRALRKAVSEKGGGEQAWAHISQWLCVWSAAKTGVQVDHGIPQGPIASDFLADIFMLPVDEAMKRKAIKYIRYVDDIRVLAKTESDARRSAIELELECRKWSLIPQSSKFVVQKANSLEEALGTLPSIIESSTKGDDEPDLDDADAEKIMRQALRGKPLKVADKSRLRYVLYRAAPRHALLRRSLDLLPRHPEHIDAFMAYFSNYSDSGFAMRRVREILRRGVLYDYVEGRLWQLVASIGKPYDFRQLMRVFRRRSRVRVRSMPLEWGLLAFAAASVRAGVYSRSSMVKRLGAANPYIQSLAVPYLDSEDFRRNGIVGKLLRQSEAEPGLAIVPGLVQRHLTHRSFGINPSHLAPQVRNAMQGVGLLPPIPMEKFDQVGDILKGRFEIDYWNKWRIVFGNEYAHALSMLLSADAKYLSDPSEWLSWQDSFDDALFRAIQSHLRRLQLPGACNLVSVKGELIDYGSLLAANGQFAMVYPDIADSLRVAHVRRNSLPTSHPYEKKTAKRATYLKPRERENIARELANAYAEVIALLDRHLP